MWNIDDAVGITPLVVNYSKHWPEKKKKYLWMLWNQAESNISNDRKYQGKKTT